MFLSLPHPCCILTLLSSSFYLCGCASSISLYSYSFFMSLYWVTPKSCSKSALFWWLLVRWVYLLKHSSRVFIPLTSGVLPWNFLFGGESFHISNGSKSKDFFHFHLQNVSVEVQNENLPSNHRKGKMSSPMGEIRTPVQLRGLNLAKEWISCSLWR